MENIAIIILSYNSSQDVTRQIDTLINEGVDKNTFYILDNNSSDGKKLETICKERQVFFHQMDTNLGYAHANNWAIRRAIAAGKRYCLILNPDIHIRKSCILDLCQHIVQDPTIAVIGPRLLHHNNPELIFSDGGLLYPKMGFQGDHLNGHKLVSEVNNPGLHDDIDYINGSAMLVNTEVLADVGYMKEDLFLYYEESEWCYRIKKSANWKIVVDSHLEAFQTNSSRGQIYEYYMTRNRLWMCRKYGGNIPYFLKDRISLMNRVRKRKDLSWTEKSIFVRKICQAIYDGASMPIH